MTLYRVPITKVGEREYTWVIYDSGQRVAHEIDPSTGKPKTYVQKNACRSAAHVRYRMLYAKDDRVLECAHRIWGYGERLDPLLEVLQELVKDIEDREGPRLAD
jgi:hypothetical protein